MKELTVTADAARSVHGWVARWTTAPDDYDTFGTLTVELCGDWYGRTLRRVLIDPDRVDSQMNRYGSGLHGSWDRDPRAEERELVERAERWRREDAERAARRTAGLEWLRSASEAEIRATEDNDTVEQRGLTCRDLREERRRRAADLADRERTATWARCRAAFHDGAILVDDGAPGQRGVYGWIPGRDPHVHYGCCVVGDWSQVADDAEVRDVAGAVVGSLQLVAERIASGQLRIVDTADVPPEPVTRRIGRTRFREIRRVDLDGRAVWAGRSSPWAQSLVLDERGHLVRGKRLRESALAAYTAAEQSAVS